VVAVVVTLVPGMVVFLVPVMPCVFVLSAVLVTFVPQLLVPLVFTVVVLVVFVVGVGMLMRQIVLATVVTLLSLAQNVMLLVALALVRRAVTLAPRVVVATAHNQLARVGLALVYFLLGLLFAHHSQTRLRTCTS
jgi:hypothetical protein